MEEPKTNLMVVEFYEFLFKVIQFFFNGNENLQNTCLLLKNQLIEKIPFRAFTYSKVTSSRLSWLIAHPSIFKMFMQGKFDAYVL